MTPEKARLHELVDSLPDETVPAAVGALERLLGPGESDPLLRALLSAPEDDEPISDEDVAEIEAGRADIKAGRVISGDEARRRILEAK
jgi:hypothetical protein